MTNVKKRKVDFESDTDIIRSNTAEDQEWCCCPCHQNNDFIEDIVPSPCPTYIEDICNMLDEEWKSITCSQTAKETQEEEKENYEASVQTEH